MKYSIDTYRLYLKEKQFHYSMRMRVKMKEKVDPVILRKAANEAIKRYSYFAVRLKIDNDGGFVLFPNSEEIAVLPVEGKTRDLGSKEVNYHLCFIEYEGQVIYFNMSHSLCGGKGVQPWIMTNVYQYVKDKYGKEPDAPGIRKPGEELLEGEDAEPTPEMLLDDESLYKGKSKDPYMPYIDYINGMFNLIQSDPTVSCSQLKGLFAYYEEIDKIRGLKGKMEYATKHNRSNGKEARKHTYMCNYSGRAEWGEVADYIEDYVAIVEGNIICEVTSLNDRLFLTLPQVIRTDKYANALNEELRDLSIPFSVSGPFEKRLPKHALPDV